MQHSATYSPEDNKLRLYPASRLSQADYEAVKAAGFQWAPKQELFVAPTWTPAREDLLLEMCEEIDDEDYSALERSADRAERFGGYRDKRRDEAGSSADRFEAGPSAFGHQNRDRAERQARRHDRHRGHAVSQWSKAEYWQARTAGVISSALYKAKPAVRRSRIKRLEAEQRKHDKTRAEYAEKFRRWSAVAALEGADRPGVYVRDGSHYGFRPDTVTPALREAFTLSNTIYSSSEHIHPRTGKAGSMYDHLTAEDPITPAEAAALWLEGCIPPGDPESSVERWARHYELRLGYERAMLANEGGAASDVEMEPGGFIGKTQIHGVTRSPVTKKVVSVKALVPKPYWRGEGPAPLVLQSFNIERLPEGSYRAPTDEERAAFQAATAERKADEKAAKPKAPPLVNPTDEDAEKLQALWNKQAEERHKAANVYFDYKPTTVRRMTQAEYSARSKGAYGSCETVDVCEHGHRPKTSYGRNADPVPVACKIRKGYAGTNCTSSAYAVIVITDKPQKPLPLDWAAIEAGTVSAPQPVTV